MTRETGERKRAESGEGTNNTGRPKDDSEGEEPTRANRRTRDLGNKDREATRAGARQTEGSVSERNTRADGMIFRLPELRLCTWG